jgi:hypothetical protein
LGIVDIQLAVTAAHWNNEWLDRDFVVLTEDVQNQIWWVWICGTGDVACFSEIIDYCIVDSSGNVEFVDSQVD